MLNRKTNNFNDFSRYYSEENQELLEKKSKLVPYTVFSFLLGLLFVSYVIYTYLLNQKTSQNTKKISTPNVIITDTSMEASSPREKVLDLKQKENIEKIVIEKIIEEKKIEKNLQKEKKETLVKKETLIKKEKTLSKKVVKVHKKTIIKKTPKRNTKIVNTVKVIDRKNLDNLSSQLEKIVNKRHFPKKRKENLSQVEEHTYMSPNIIYREEKLSIPTH